MFNRLAVLPRRASGIRMFSDARPMTRFVQYPFDKTKMDEVRSWLNDSDTPAAIRATPGVQDVQFSFCPGEGWLAARYIFDDLDGLRAFPDSAAFAQAKDEVTTHPHYDSSRQPHEFKGFFLPEV